MSTSLVGVLVGVFVTQFAPLPDDGRLERDFIRSVNAYVGLHRDIEGPLPPEAITNSTTYTLRK
jgi:hypothetical protein